MYNLKLMLHLSFNKLFKIRFVVVILLFLLDKALRKLVSSAQKFALSDDLMMVRLH